MKIAYQTRKFSAAILDQIDQANQIIAAYAAQGYDLTLRQLYYQFVSKNLLPNTEKSYKNLGSAINDGRMAGLIDWNAIVDRTRRERANSHWDSPQDILKICANTFAVDKWKDQPWYVSVAIEKDALIGVIEGVCEQNDVPYTACRGYASASEVWAMGHRRIRPRLRQGKKVCVLYLGDHDPSGIDMTRDLYERLCLFAGKTDDDHLEVRRLALNMNQVQQYNPPPNPTKLTDSRAGSYVSNFGNDCWELDALAPPVIAALIQKAIDGIVKKKIWAQSLAFEQECKDRLGDMSRGYDEIVQAIKDGTIEVPEEST